MCKALLFPFEMSAMRVASFLGVVSLETFGLVSAWYFLALYSVGLIGFVVVSGQVINETDGN